MNFSQAIVKAIKENVNVEFTDDCVNFVVLAPRKEVSRRDTFYHGKAIIQIEGAKGSEIDFISLYTLYQDLALEKGDKIFVYNGGGDYKAVTFHHMYKFNDKEARIIAHAENGEELDISWVDFRGLTAPFSYDIMTLSTTGE